MSRESGIQKFYFIITYIIPHKIGPSLSHPSNADEEKKMNATYIISVARKLGCSVFLLPEDIMEVRVAYLRSFSFASTNLED